MPTGSYVFDDGLAILTGDNGRTSETHLYFTDGAPSRSRSLVGIERVTAGEVGSLLVWLDGDDVVIYDTHVRGVVARVPLNGRRLANPIIPLEDAVYWTEYDDTATDGRAMADWFATTCRPEPGLARREADYRAEARAAPPLLVVGSADSTDPAEDFTVVDSRLEVDTDGQGAPPPVFVAATGERLRVSVPDGYDGETLGVFQWLDDDRFALVVEGGVKRVPIGDLLVCRISAGQCRTVASGEQDWLLPGPSGGVGAED